MRQEEERRMFDITVFGFLAHSLFTFKNADHKRNVQSSCEFISYIFLVVNEDLDQ